MTLQDFIKQYQGKSGVGNTAENKGQCVGLVELWIRDFGFDQIWGNAKDLYTNAPEKDFIKIPNDPLSVVQEGDIVVWNGLFNGGVGHTGIAVKGDINKFDCFEQNDPIGSTPHIKTYNYLYITGWLRSKNSTIIAQPITITDQTKIPANRLSSSNFPVTEDKEIQQIRGLLSDYGIYMQSHPTIVVTNPNPNTIVTGYTTPKTVDTSADDSVAIQTFELPPFIQTFIDWLKKVFK